MTTLFVHATFADEAHAQKAIDELVDAHFVERDIHVLVREGPRVRELPVTDHKTHVGPFALAGSGIGLVVGAILAVVGLGVDDDAWLLASLEGAVLGALFGAVWGALAGLGLWKAKAWFPSAKGQQGGGVLVGVTTYAERVQEARDCLRRAGGIRDAASREPVMDTARHELLAA